MMQQRFFYRFLICLAVVVVPVFAQNRFIPLNVDYATFHSPKDSEFLELYISFPQKSLQYHRQEEIWVSKFSISLTVKRGNDTVFEQSQPFVNKVETLDNINQFSELRHIFFCELPAGNYLARINLTDENAGVSGEYELSLTINPNTADALSMSDIQLSAKISKADGQTPFDKNGLQVVPNPSGVYHVSMPILYFYAETHGLSYDSTTAGTYTLETYVTDTNGEIIREFPVKKKQKPGRSTILVGGNNVVTLPSATYFLNLKLTDDQTGNSVERKKRFTMFKPSEESVEQVRAMTTKLMQSYYEKFSEDLLDEEFSKVRYIATKDEINTFKGLAGIPSKAEFLADFWRTRDPDPTTSQNEFKIDYFKQVDFVDQNFKTKFKSGWKTDRGRVVLTYGKPDEIERSPMQSSTRPYEIWSYLPLENGCIFVFADLQGFGEFELLHSTYRKEVYQPDWERRVRLIRDNSTLDLVPDDFQQ